MPFILAEQSYTHPWLSLLLSSNSTFLKTPHEEPMDPTLAINARSGGTGGP